MENLIIWAIPIALLALGFFAGGHTERRHIRNLEEREAATSDMIVTQVKSFPGHVPGPQPPQMIVAEVVIATDYLKSFLARIRNFFGGQIGSYQTMLIRARTAKQRCGFSNRPASRATTPSATCGSKRPTSAAIPRPPANAAWSWPRSSPARRRITRRTVPE